MSKEWRLLGIQGNIVETQAVLGVSQITGPKDEHICGPVQR